MDDYSLRREVRAGDVFKTANGHMAHVTHVLVPQDKFDQFKIVGLVEEEGVAIWDEKGKAIDDSDSRDLITPPVKKENSDN